MPVCACCGNVDESHKIVNCCICKKSFRIDCVKITVSEARKIHSKTGFTWSCSNCLTLGDDMNGLKSIIVSLQDDIKVLKDALLQSTTAPSASLLDTERIVQEVADRDRRKNNIVIFGRDEGNCDSNAQQVNLDTTLVNDICTALQVDARDFKVTRLGKFDPTAARRKRPIRVSFPSESSANRIMQKISKLRSLTEFSTLSIYRDKTPMQLQIHKDAKIEMLARLNSGEKNLKIKYNRGIPKIISLN